MALNIQDYVDFCRHYFLASGLPLTLWNNRELCYSSLQESLDQKYTPMYFFENSTRNPDISPINSNTFYGRLAIKDTSCIVILGPVYNVPVTESLVREFMHDNAISQEHRTAITAFLAGTPLTSHHQFLHHLAFFSLSLNHEKIDPSSYFMQSERNTNRLSATHLQQTYENKENASLHNTYFFEQYLYQYIREGNPDRLQEFLQNTQLSIREGVVADSPLRQAKNIFIGTVTKVGMLGGIQGGMDVEEAYQLIDLYIQKCEQLTSLSAISELTYRMIMDFCQRTGHSQVPEGVSGETYACMLYIRNHTNENISVSDVAALLNRSNSYVIKKFKKELGINIGAYINRCKLEEAKSLLIFTDKPLSEISTYLCYSSQAYFQNVFKKKYGITPMQYRIENQQNFK